MIMDVYRSQQLSSASEVVPKRASGKSMVWGGVSLRATPARQKGIIEDWLFGAYDHASSKSLREPSLQELSSFAVALNWGIGSSSLKADVNAFARLQMVLDRNSSYFGSKYRSWTVRVRCFGASSAFQEGLVDDRLRGHVRQFAPLPCFHLLAIGSKFRCMIHADRDAIDQGERFRVRTPA